MIPGQPVKSPQHPGGKSGFQSQSPSPGIIGIIGDLGTRVVDLGSPIIQLIREKTMNISTFLIKSFILGGDLGGKRGGFGGQGGDFLDFSNFSPNGPPFPPPLVPQMGGDGVENLGFLTKLGDKRANIGGTMGGNIGVTRGRGIWAARGIFLGIFNRGISALFSPLVFSQCRDSIVALQETRFS